MQEKQVIIATWSDVRRAVYAALEGLEARNRGRLASAVCDALRAAGLLRGLEQHYNAKQVAELLGRSDEYVLRLVRTEQIQPAYRDGGSWIIPASAVQAWLDAHTFGKSSRIHPNNMGECAGKMIVKGDGDWPDGPVA